MMKLGIRKIVEEALEAEVSDALGRSYYERGGEPGRGYRNGTRTGWLKTAEGVVEDSVLQVADRMEPFRFRARSREGTATSPSPAWATTVGRGRWSSDPTVRSNRPGHILARMPA